MTNPPHAPRRGSEKKIRVQKKAGRSKSSRQWLERQLNDPYVRQAQKKGYRSRSAFKLLQIQEKFGIFKSGQVVLDLGAAPGGWVQVALDLVGEKGFVMGVDILPIKPLAPALTFEGDMTEEETLKRIFLELTTRGFEKRVDVVMSDMAANTIGHKQTDHLRTVLLAEAALQTALDVLSPGGHFICKVFQGGADKNLLDQLKAHFESVKHFKPPASRAESPEMYVVAKGLKHSD